MNKQEIIHLTAELLNNDYYQKNNTVFIWDNSFKYGKIYQVSQDPSKHEDPYSYLNENNILNCVIELFDSEEFISHILQDTLLDNIQQLHKVIFSNNLLFSDDKTSFSFISSNLSLLKNQENKEESIAFLEIFKFLKQLNQPQINDLLDISIHDTDIVFPYETSITYSLDYLQLWKKSKFVSFSDFKQVLNLNFSSLQNFYEHLDCSSIHNFESDNSLVLIFNQPQNKELIDLFLHKSTEFLASIEPTDYIGFTINYIYPNEFQQIALYCVIKQHLGNKTYDNKKLKI